MKRFNANQKQKCSFDCLLLASFSVVISLSYFVRSISLVAGVDVAPHVVEDEVAEDWEEVVVRN